MLATFAESSVVLIEYSIGTVGTRRPKRGPHHKGVAARVFEGGPPWASAWIRLTIRRNWNWRLVQPSIQM